MPTKKKGAATPAAAEKILRLGIERDDERWVYFVDRRGNLNRMERGVPRAKTELVAATGLKREKGMMYFLDDDGDLCKAPDRS